MNVPLRSWDTLELFFGRRPRNCAALPVGLRRFLVAPVPVRDLLLRAKDLFIAAIVAGIHRTEMIPLRGTLARPREVLGWDPVQPPGTLSRGYPARIKLGVPEISKSKNPEGSRIWPEASSGLRDRQALQG